MGLARPDYGNNVSEAERVAATRYDDVPRCCSRYHFRASIHVVRASRAVKCATPFVISRFYDARCRYAGPSARAARRN